MSYTFFKETQLLVLIMFSTSFFTLLSSSTLYLFFLFSLSQSLCVCLLLYQLPSESIKQPFTKLTRCAKVFDILALLLTEKVVQSFNKHTQALTHTHTLAHTHTASPPALPVSPARSLSLTRGVQFLCFAIKLDAASHILFQLLPPLHHPLHPR